jgi:uncharacterized protein
MIRQFLRIASYLIVALVFSAPARADSYVDFFRAIERDDGGAITQLLKRGLDPNLRDPNGQTGLFLALRGASPAAVNALMASPQLDVNAANAKSETALMMAALRGEVDMLQRLLARGATLHQAGWSAVHYAATGPNPEALALLLDRGAPLEARSPNGSTPLMMAAGYGPEAAVDLLLKRGADRKLKNDLGLTPADFATQAGREKLAARLR